MLAVREKTPIMAGHFGDKRLWVVEPTDHLRPAVSRHNRQVQTHARSSSSYFLIPPDGFFVSPSFPCFVSSPVSPRHLSASLNTRWMVRDPRWPPPSLPPPGHRHRHRHRHCHRQRSAHQVAAWQFGMRSQTSTAWLTCCEWVRDAL